MVTYAKIFPKMENPRAKSGNAEEEEEECVFIYCHDSASVCAICAYLHNREETVRMCTLRLNIKNFSEQTMLLHLKPLRFG